VNSGWTRGQGVVRCDGETNEPRMFPTFCPKAIGLKGTNLPETTASRAIPIEMQRKLGREAVEDFRHCDDDDLARLRRQLSCWAADHAKELATASPTLPVGFTNRRAANWRLLIAIADAAGGNWPDKARAAAASIAGLNDSLEASNGTKLLGAI